MKIKRKDKEEGSEKRDLTKKVGIASSSIVGSGIGALSGYGLSRIGEEKRKKKIADEHYQTNKNISKRLLEKRGLSKEEIEGYLKSTEQRLKMEARRKADEVKTPTGRKLGFIVPGAIIGATAGGIAYDKITKKKRRSRDNENNTTK